MNYAIIFVILMLLLLSAILRGSILLKRAFSFPEFLPEEVVLACAWVFIVGSLIWLAVFLSDSSLLGFTAPWTWLAAVHFAFAGFGALTITGLSCRVVSDFNKRRVLRFLLIVHPFAYLVTAAGIYGFSYCEELGAISYFLLFVTQFWAFVFGRPDRMSSAPRRLLVLAMIVPVITIIPALAWAWERPIFDLEGMIRYHGIVNAIGHVGFGFVAFLWGRPPPHCGIYPEVKVELKT